MKCPHCGEMSDSDSWILGGDDGDVREFGALENDADIFDYDIAVCPECATPVSVEEFIQDQF